MSGEPQAGQSAKIIMEKSTVVAVKEEINKQLANAETVKSLLDTTFKGLQPEVMKRALLEGMIRGFSFQNFLERDVYAIPYGQTYSLVTSIDYSRKIGAKSGVVGVEAPKYVEDGGKIISCSVTVHKRFPDGYVGDFTAEVFMDEYSTGRNLWSSKPRTMISKVAEMHALRKACPEELAQAYVAEEMERESAPAIPALNITALEKMVRGAKTLEELKNIWADLPGDAKASATLKEAFADMEAILKSETAEPAVEKAA